MQRSYQVRRKLVGNLRITLHLFKKQLISIYLVLIILRATAIPNFTPPSGIYINLY
jgi:hypothetical protein